MRRKDLGRAATGGVLEKNSARPKPGGAFFYKVFSPQALDKSLAQDIHLERA